jgi:hypothetical protein
VYYLFFLFHVHILHQKKGPGYFFTRDHVNDLISGYLFLQRLKAQEPVQASVPIFFSVVHPLLRRTAASGGRNDNVVTAANQPA